MEYALKYQQHMKGLIISNMMASIPAYNEYAEQVLMPAMDQEVLARIKAFEAAGYEVPTTFDEFTALVDQMVADGITPLCGANDGRWSFGNAADVTYFSIEFVDTGGVPFDLVIDTTLIDDALALIAEKGLGPADYEFQMLLGVREDKRREILGLGHGLRVYVPFGEDWYGYSSRRLKENPDMAGMIAKAVLLGQ